MEDEPRVLQEQDVNQDEQVADPHVVRSIACAR
jgi:hypothetical protein